MRYSILSFATAPLAFLSIGGLEAKAYPTVGYTESITCAAIGNNRAMRAALGCPVMDLVPRPQEMECPTVDCSRVNPALINCPRPYPYPPFYWFCAYK